MPFPLTPFRIIYPILLIAFVATIARSKWVPLYLLAIGAFIIDSLLLLLIDYVFIGFFRLKKIWIIEILLILLLLLIKWRCQLDWVDMVFAIF